MSLQPDPVPGHPQPGMHLWGWMLPDELAWLSVQAEVMDSVVEIGSLHGRSAYALLDACPGPVYCVDPWNDDGYASFIRACGHFDNLVPIRNTSPQVASWVPDVDMVFIDGAHDYDSVRADIDAWRPKTRRLLAGHDYGHPGFPGVKQAVDETFGPLVVNPLPLDPDTGGIWYVRI